MSNKSKLTIRSVAPETRARLTALKQYTRLTYGSLVDDAVEALWEAYQGEGHDVEGVLW